MKTLVSLATCAAALFSLAASPILHAAEMSLLNGHLSATLPDEAVYGQRGTSLMGPGPGDNETLIWVGEGSKRVAILVLELGRYAPANFSEAQMKSMQDALEELDFEYGELPGMVYGIATKSPASPRGADLLGTADVRHEDGTMQRISFYFAEDRARDIQACRKLMLDVLGSVKKGDKNLPLHAREEKIAQVDAEGNSLILPLPEHSFAVHAEGADFLLNDYSLMSPGGEARTGMLRIYVGHHPGDVETEGAEQRKTTLLGKEAAWSISHDARRGRHYAECLLPVNGEGLYTHLIIMAGSPEEREQYIRWAEQLRLGQPGAEVPAKP